MTALYIAGYALGAVLTWVILLRLAAKDGSSLTWSLCFQIVNAALIWPLFWALLLGALVVRKHGIAAPGTRLFNYFKRRV